MRRIMWVVVDPCSVHYKKIITLLYHHRFPICWDKTISTGCPHALVSFIGVINIAITRAAQDHFVHFICCKQYFRSRKSMNNLCLHSRAEVEVDGRGRWWWLCPEEKRPADMHSLWLPGYIRTAWRQLSLATASSSLKVSITVLS